MDKHHVIDCVVNLSKSNFGSSFLAEYTNWHNVLVNELPTEVNFLLKNQKNPQKLINFNDLIKHIDYQMEWYKSQYKSQVSYDKKDILDIKQLNNELWKFIIGLENVWLNDCNGYTSLDLFLKKISDFKEEASTQIILSNPNNISSVVASGDTMSLNVVEYVINNYNEDISASSNGSSWVRADNLLLPKNLAKADFYYLNSNESQEIPSNRPKDNTNIVENNPSLEAKSGLGSWDYVMLSNFINNVVNTEGLTNDNFKTVHERYYNNSDKLCVYKLGGLNTSKNLKNCNQVISIDFHGNLWKDTPKYLEDILNTKIMNTFDWFANYYGIDESIYDFLNLKGQGTINENSSILIKKLNSNGILNLNDSRLIGGDNVIDLNTSKNPLFMKSWYIKSPLFYGLHKNNIDIN